MLWEHFRNYYQIVHYGLIVPYGLTHRMYHMCVMGFHYDFPKTPLRVFGLERIEREWGVKQ